MPKPDVGPKPTHHPIVLGMLRDAKGTVVSPEAFAERLYGTPGTPAQQASVRKMIQRIRKHGRRQYAVVNVFRQGYRLVSEVRP